MGSLSITDLGDFDTPQVLIAASGFQVFILGQWWYDFSRIAEPNIAITMGIEGAAPPTQGGDFGLYILPDGDVNSDQLFDGAHGGSPPLSPDIEVFTTPHSSFPTFIGVTGTVVIANPGSKMQILLAVNVSHAGSSVGASEIQYRSVLINIVGST